MELDEGLSDPDLVEFDRRVSVVHAAVASILDMTWLQLYEHWDEVTIPTAVAMALNADKIMVWRVHLNDPVCCRFCTWARRPRRQPKGLTPNCECKAPGATGPSTRPRRHRSRAERGPRSGRQ